MKKKQYERVKMSIAEISRDDVITTSPLVDGGDIGPWDTNVRIRKINIGNDAGIQGGAN